MSQFSTSMTLYVTAGEKDKFYINLNTFTISQQKEPKSILVQAGQPARYVKHQENFFKAIEPSFYEPQVQRFHSFTQRSPQLPNVSFNQPDPVLGQRLQEIMDKLQFSDVEINDDRNGQEKIDQLERLVGYQQEEREETVVSLSKMSLADIQSIQLADSVKMLENKKSTKKISIKVQKLQQLLWVLKTIKKRQDTDVSGFFATLNLQKSIRIEHVDSPLIVRSQQMAVEELQELIIPISFIMQNDEISVNVEIDDDEAYNVVVCGYLNNTRLCELSYQFTANEQINKVFSVPFKYYVEIVEPSHFFDPVGGDIQLQLNINGNGNENAIWWNNSGYLEFSIPLHPFCQQFKSEDKAVDFPDCTLRIQLTDANGRAKQIQKFPKEMYSPSSSLSYDLSKLSNLNYDLIMQTKTVINSFLVRDAIQSESVQQGDVLLVTFECTPTKVATFASQIKKMQPPHVQVFDNLQTPIQGCPVLSGQQIICFACIGLFDSSGAIRGRGCYNCRIVGGSPSFVTHQRIIQDFDGNEDISSVPQCLSCPSVCNAYQDMQKEPLTILPFQLPIQIINNSIFHTQVQNFSRLLKGVLIKSQSEKMFELIQSIAKLHSWHEKQKYQLSLDHICDAGGEINEAAQKIVAFITFADAFINSYQGNLEEIFKSANVLLISLIIPIIQLITCFDISKIMDLRVRLLSQTSQMSYKLFTKQYFTNNVTGLARLTLRFEKSLRANMAYAEQMQKIYQSFNDKQKIDILQAHVLKLDVLTKFSIQTKLNTINNKPLDIAELKLYDTLYQNQLIPEQLAYTLQNMNESAFNECIPDVVVSIVTLAEFCVEGTGAYDQKQLKQTIYTSFQELIMVMVAKVQNIIRLCCTAVFLRGKPEFANLIAKYYPDLKMLHQNDLSQDVIYMANLYIKILAKRNVRDKTLTEALQSVFFLMQSNTLNCSSAVVIELLQQCLINLKFLLCNEQFVRLFLEQLIMRALQPENEELLLTVMDIILRNHAIPAIHSLTETLVNDFLQIGIKSIRKQDKKMSKLFFDTFPMMQYVDFSQIKVLPERLCGICYLLLANVRIDDFDLLDSIVRILASFNMSLQDLVADSKADRLLNGSRSKLLEILCNEQLSEEDSIQLSDEAVPIYSFHPSMASFYNYIKCLLNTASLPRFGALSSLAHAFKGEFSKKAGQQVLFAMAEEGTYQKFMCQSDIELITTVLRSTKSNLMLEAAYLIENYSTKFQQLNEYSELITELLKPLSKSQLKDFASLSEDLSIIAIESKCVCAHVVERIEPALYGFYQLLKEYDDPRAHWVLDVLFALYFQTDNRHSVDIIELKRQLIEQNYPDIYFILNVILNQRHLLTVQKSEPKAFPVDGQPYPNFVIQNGATTVRELFKAYLSDFKSASYLILEDFEALLQFYRPKYCFLEGVLYKQAFKLDENDEQETYLLLIQLVQRFVDVMISALPASLILLRSGQQPPATNSSKTLLQTVNKTIQLPRALQIQNFASSIQYFTTGRQMGECSAGFQALCASRVNRLETLPFITLDDLRFGGRSASLLISFYFETVSCCLQSYKNFSQVFEKLKRLQQIEDGTPLFLGTYPTLLPKFNTQQLLQLQFSSGYFDRNYWSGQIQRRFLILEPECRILTVSDNQLKQEEIAQRIRSTGRIEIYPLLNNKTIIGQRVVGVTALQNFVCSDCSIQSLAEQRPAVYFYRTVSDELSVLHQHYQNSTRNPQLEQRALIAAEQLLWLQETGMSLAALDEQFETEHGLRLLFCSFQQFQNVTNVDQEEFQKVQAKLIDIMKMLEPMELIVAVKIALEELDAALQYLVKSSDSQVRERAAAVHRVFTNDLSSVQQIKRQQREKFTPENKIDRLFEQLEAEEQERIAAAKKKKKGWFG